MFYGPRYRHFYSLHLPGVGGTLPGHVDSPRHVSSVTRDVGRFILRQTGVSRAMGCRTLTWSHDQNSVNKRKKEVFGSGKTESTVVWCVGGKQKLQ